MAGKFMSKMMDIIGLEEEYEEEEEFYEDELPAKEVSKPRRAERVKREQPELSEIRSREPRQLQERPVPRREEVPSIADRKRKGRLSEVTGGTGDVKLVVYRPHSYNDSQNIIDNLISNKPIIVNLDDLENDVAQRVLDFMSGAAYSLGGSVMKVSRGIFLIAPNNVDVLGNLEEEMRTNDFFNLNYYNE